MQKLKQKGRQYISERETQVKPHGGSVLELRQTVARHRKDPLHFHTVLFISYLRDCVQWNNQSLERRTSPMLVIFRTVFIQRTARWGGREFCPSVVRRLGTHTQSLGQGVIVLSCCTLLCNLHVLNFLYS